MKESYSLLSPRTVCENVQGFQVPTCGGVQDFYTTSDIGSIGLCCEPVAMEFTEQREHTVEKDALYPARFMHHLGRPYAGTGKSSKEAGKKEAGKGESGNPSDRS